MKNLFKTILLVVVITYWPFSVWAGGTDQENQTERNHFHFVISQYHTTRQSGQIVNIYVKYAYKKDLPTSQYPDYRVMRAKVLQHMEPSEELPANVFWEIIATQMGRELMKDFPLEGVSIQLTVLDNQDPNRYEPGDHGPIFTIGNIAPLA